MKFFTSLTLLLCMFVQTRADHVLGGELMYEHVSGNTYKIILNVYGECSGVTFSHLKIAKPRITVLNELGALNTLILNEEADKRREITNVCPDEADKTTCKSPSGNIPGTTMFVYTATTQLTPAANWRIIFGGQMDNSGKLQSGYTFLLSNVLNNTGFGFYMLLEATLNNLHEPNSSPKYTTPPIPHYCIYSPQQYSPGAVDKDNDVLRYSLIPPYDINGIATKYVAPYSATRPFSSTAGTFTFNSTNGQMSFTPDKAEVALVVHKTEEYRNGALMGTSMRAMTFFFRSVCDNQAPDGSIDPGSVYGAMPEGNTVNTCKQEDWVRFKIPVNDKNGNNVVATVHNIPPGAHLSVNNNGSTNPEIEFTWEVKNVVPGIYTFYVEYDDGVCPIPGHQTVAYTVNIAYPITVFHRVLSPTNCLYRQQVQFTLDGGILPRKLIISDANTGTVVTNYSDINGTINDSFAVGQYKLLAYSDNLSCSTEYNFEVADYGTYPYPPQIKDKNLCVDAPVLPLVATPAQDGQMRWYDINGSLMQEAPVYTTTIPATYRWVLNQKVDVCESVYDTVEVVVHAHPVVETLTEGGRICIGEDVLLQANGAERYDWQPEDKVKMIDGKPHVNIYQPETYVVTGYSRYGCTDTDTLVFNEIELCCRFDYPTAFSPNGDGLNDGWHPLVHGNLDYYRLFVFNRWGEVVFQATDPQQRWDGTQRGGKCDVGTYYYRVNAGCLTGQKEENSGTILLLR